MAITTHAELVTAVGNWLNRSDLTDRIPEFIVLAEAKFKRDPRVRDFSNSSASVTALADGVNWLLTSHPDIYLYGALVESGPFLHDDARIPVWEAQLEKRLAELQTSRTDMSRTLALASYADLLEMVAEYLNRPDLAPNVGAWVTLAEASLKRDLAGAPTISALSSGVNWLFSSHPDVYLYATLCEAAPWLGSDPRLAEWKALRDERVAEVLRSRSATAYDLATYAGLQTAVKGFLDRQDIDAAALVTLAEARLRKDIRVRRLENHGSLTVDAESETLPTDFHTLEALYHNGGTYYGPLDIVGADQLGTIRGQYAGASGAPRAAAVVEGALVFAPVPDNTYTLRMVYWQTIAALSSGVNWLLTSHPDIYLYASLLEGAPYVKDVSLLPVWAEKLEGAIQALDRTNWNVRFGGGTMRRSIRAIG